MGTFSTNLLLTEPTPGDPAVRNNWGTILNTNDALLDSAVTGILSLSVAGSSNVTLTSAAGSADQARNVHFIFTGAITGNILVLFPPSLQRNFTVLNSTTGAFTLGIGVSNGSGGAVGSTVNVPAGLALFLLSDGTNITQRFASFNTLTVGSLSLTTQLSVANGGTGIVTAAAHGVLVGAGTSGFNVTTTGTSGQVLTSNGASADPTWQSASAGTAVTSIADGTNGGLSFSGATGAVTAALLPSDLLTKTTPVPGDSVIIMDSAASNAPKTALLSALPTARIVGEVIGWGTNTAPSFWKICDGSAISRTTYSGLFGVWGTTYGTGDGSTTFNLPDWRGRVMVGGNNASLPNGTNGSFSTRALGSTGGEETHLLTSTESGTTAHGHTASSSASGASVTGSSSIPNGNGDTGFTTAFTSSSGISVSTTVNNASAASAASAHNNMQPFLVFNHIVYTGAA